jgi:hypothetical protein
MSTRRGSITLLLASFYGMAGSSAGPTASSSSHGPSPHVRSEASAVALAGVGIGGQSSARASDRTTAGPTTLTAIPAEYHEPPGGWTPQCSANQKVCAYRARKGSEAFVLVNGKPGAPYEDIGLLAVSSDGAHVAYAAKRKDAWVVVADGKEGQEFDKIERLTFFGSLPMYVAGASGRVRDESDGVFRGTRRVEGFRANGVEGTQEVLDVVVGDRVDDNPVVAEERRGTIQDIAMSPDGKSYAYVMEERGSSGPGALWILMVNGKELTEDHGLEVFSFTQDGRLAYAARTGSFADGRARIYIGNKAVVTRTGDITAGAVSLDGRRLAYVSCTGSQPARRGTPRVLGQCALMLDEKVVEEAPEDVIDNLTLSPNGAVLAFTERQADGQMRVTVGDRVGPTVNGLSGKIIFSPDGARHAYAVKIGESSAVVADGVLGPMFDSVDALRFGKDSKHLAYTGTRGQMRHIVLDQTVDPTGFVWVSPPQFDASGRSVSFVAQEGRNFSRRTIPVGRQ